MSSIGSPAGVEGYTSRPDGTSVAAFATLSTYTWFLYGVGPSLPLFRDELHTTSAVAGLHSLMQAAGVILSGIAGVALARRWRRYGVARRGVVIFAAAALVFIGGSLVSGAELAFTLPAMIGVGFAGGLAINISTTVLQEHNGPYGPALLSTGNAVAAGVGLVTPLAVGVATALGFTWRAALVLVVPFAALAFVLITRQRAVPAYSATPVTSSRFSVRGLPAGYWPACLSVVCAVAIEFCMITWTPDLLADRAGMSPGSASGAVAAVVGGMAIGRLIVGALAKHRPPLGLFLAGVGVTVVGWALVWASASPLTAVAGLIVVGLGVAGQYPLGASMVMGLSGGQPDRAVAVLTVGVGLASGLGPFALGAMADQIGVRTAFFVVPLLCVVGGAACAAGQRSGRRAGAM